VRALLISDRRVKEAFSTLRAVYRKCAWLAGGAIDVKTFLRFLFLSFFTFFDVFYFPYVF